MRGPIVNKEIKMTGNIIVDSREVEELTAEEIERVAGGLLGAICRSLWEIRSPPCNICIPEGEDIRD
jgi:hypothetical protein